MVSRMDSICERYAAGCTKTEPKILQVKRGQKQRNAPDSARKRRNWVRFGCWRGWQRLETDKNLVRKPGVRTQMNTKTMQHMKKENRRKPSVFAGFLAGAEGLSLAGRLGRFAAERHWRSLTPRHAVLEWMWKNASERGEGAVLPVFFCKTKTCGAGLVLFGSPVPKHEMKVRWKSLRMSSLKSYICMYTEE